jgi:hypothetical protein
MVLQHVEPLLGNNLETNNETTFAACNRFLISKYTQPLLGNAFETTTFPRKRVSTTINGVFYAVRAEMLTGASLEASQSQGTLWKENLIGAV